MACLGAVLVAETLGVLLGGAFMSDRLARSGVDMYQRIAHWQRGVTLLHTRTQWLLGVGWLPTHYSTQTSAAALPGQVRWTRGADGSTQAWLAGPSRPDVGGEFAPVQRAALAPGGVYTSRISVELNASARLAARLCKQHLLYALQCQLRSVQLFAPRDSRIILVELSLWEVAFAMSYVFAETPYGVFCTTVLPAKEPVGLYSVN